jgi:subtilisin family serine protease
MSLQLSRQGFSLRTPRETIQTCRGPHLGKRRDGVFLVLLLLASLAYGRAPLGSPTPPPPPQIPPVISTDYASDWDGNRINDKLEAGAQARGGISIASVDEEMVPVELVFREPVTQPQIDEFLRLGGQITYLYRAISFGWTGRIPRASLASLPAALGPTLVQVEPIQRLGAYLDVATQTGRVRPVWQAGFAGSGTGFTGDANTTIGFIGSGIDATHTDLRGRGVYWRDFSDDNEPKPVDFEGHESAVAGVALGTGAAGGVNTGMLHLTYASLWPSYFHMPYPLSVPDGEITSVAEWTGPAATLFHYGWIMGTASDLPKTIGNTNGKSPLILSNTLTNKTEDHIAVILAELDEMKNLGDVVITTSVAAYPGLGGGINKFRGVAPGCTWAAAKVVDKEGNADTEQFTAAFDDMVVHRQELKLKVINVSFGLQDELGFPEESTSLRDKVNSIVNNGIVVVAAAGNNATKSSSSWRRMADPPRAAQAITVGATDDGNWLTEYSNYGFPNPRPEAGEDFKPDVVAPGGSQYFTGIITVDSGTSDGRKPDKEPNDYVCEAGTSFAAPFVAGSAALVIQAMERQGVPWRFDSSAQPRYVKMLLCATASETNAKREGTDRTADPTLERAAAGPNGFPAGKDQHEGYGLINPDAAVEAISLTHVTNFSASDTLDKYAESKRVWARIVNLGAGHDIDITLTNPAAADFDLYLYSGIPSDTGTPILLASSTHAGAGVAESIHYVPSADTPALLVVKRVSGTGTFTLRSTQSSPPTASDVQAFCGVNTPRTITLKATDGNAFALAGAISYIILSKPAHGQLEFVDGPAITDTPVKLPNLANEVIYRPPADWTGQDSFTFCADDGGTPPSGGASNTGTVTITVKGITVEQQVKDGGDDASSAMSAAGLWPTRMYSYVGARVTGMRFPNIEIPQGATIVGATLKVCAVTSTDFDVDGFLKGEAVDNASAFTSGQTISALPMTTASTNWKWTQDEPWIDNTWYESPNIGPIIQEIVNRPGWYTDHALVIIYMVNNASSGSRAFMAADTNPSLAPKLSITYTVPSTQPGPPTATDVEATCLSNAPATITLKATDDGPPGALSYTILSTPAQGRLELPNGTPITEVPAKLPSDQVVYKAPPDWAGQDSFTFCADDGGTAPLGGQSNTAAVKITVVTVKEVTVEYQVTGSADDVSCSVGSVAQWLTDRWLGVGTSGKTWGAGMRFSGVKIPQGSTIVRASLKICTHPDTLGGRVDGVLKGEATDNAQPFAMLTRLILKLTTTTASTPWKWTKEEPWAADTWYESPDLKAIVQEIVNRPGWASDNALVITYLTTQGSSVYGDRKFWSFDGDPTKAAKLSITYQAK